MARRAQEGRAQEEVRLARLNGCKAPRAELRPRVPACRYAMVPVRILLNDPSYTESKMQAGAIYARLRIEGFQLGALETDSCVRWWNRFLEAGLAEKRQAKKMKHQ